EADYLLNPIAHFRRVLARLGLRAMLPALDHRNAVAPGLEDATADLFGLWTGEPGDESGNPFGITPRHTFLALPGAQSRCHTGLRTRRDRVDGHTDPVEFAGGQ